MKISKRKIIVIKNKLSYIVRNVIKGDFRASGGGILYFNFELVIEQIKKSAFRVANELDFQCMGFDYVVDNKENKGELVEISYGFYILH